MIWSPLTRTVVMLVVIIGISLHGDWQNASRSSKFLLLAALGISAMQLAFRVVSLMLTQRPRCIRCGGPPSPSDRGDLRALDMPRSHLSRMEKVWTCGYCLGFDRRES
jgi:hypothetical protein